MRQFRLSVITRIVLVWLAAGHAVWSWADVYVRTDAEGVEHYTNQPGLEGYSLIVAVLRLEGVRNEAGAAPVPDAVARFGPYVAAAADEFNVDKALVHAVITVESGYNPTAVSRAGAQGLMQLMPATARRYSVADSFDPAANIRGGVRYLRDLLLLFDGKLELVIAAYNAGENAVQRHGNRIPPYRETQAYVPKVLRFYEKFRAAL